MRKPQYIRLYSYDTTVRLKLEKYDEPDQPYIATRTLHIKAQDDVDAIWNAAEWFRSLLGPSGEKVANIDICQYYIQSIYGATLHSGELLITEWGFRDFDYLGAKNWGSYPSDIPYSRFLPNGVEGEWGDLITAYCHNHDHYRSHMREKGEG